MAMADYILCAKCGNKAVYDGGGEMRDRAEDDYHATLKALCAGCTADGYEFIVSHKDADPAREERIDATT